jgi:hypothetical protein
MKATFYATMLASTVSTRLDLDREADPDAQEPREPRRLSTAARKRRYSARRDPGSSIGEAVGGRAVHDDLEVDPGVVDEVARLQCHQPSGWRRKSASSCASGSAAMPTRAEGGGDRTHRDRRHVDLAAAGAIDHFVERARQARDVDGEALLSIAGRGESRTATGTSEIGGSSPRNNGGADACCRAGPWPARCATRAGADTACATCRNVDVAMLVCSGWLMTTTSQTGDGAESGRNRTPGVA